MNTPIRLALTNLAVVTPRLVILHRFRLVGPSAVTYSTAQSLPKTFVLFRQLTLLSFGQWHTSLLVKKREGHISHRGHPERHAPPYMITTTSQRCSSCRLDVASVALERTNVMIAEREMNHAHSVYDWNAKSASLYRWSASR